ncbi:hypothetical protein Sta7437_1494 [Stanieria cyanosphaera PCC 7437]|uniref:Uncharacterized protein n=1 Tax=Stanieria cyanosphaera (strain ATCC 29371 / PCC 7437) TaxID=111780 RepID=K9XSM8_STAC7|nr:hypothetical protein [Stanieria cyanosphaera]AFZ35061.1 hypothetical protein Sta7437_1494 [Stanieria cyanosphaera PCC 7437]
MTKSQSSQSVKYTWGKFDNQTAARTTKTKIEQAGIAPEQVTLETENFQLPLQLQNTQIAKSVKGGAIAGTVLGAVIGLYISLVVTDFPRLGFAVFNDFNSVYFFAPLLGSGVGALTIGLIAALSGGNVPKPDVDLTTSNQSVVYLVAVKGTAAEINQAQEIIRQQGGTVEEEDRNSTAK